MVGPSTLQQLDDSFIDIYEADRARVVESQKRQALIVFHRGVLADATTHYLDELLQRNATTA